MLLRLLASETDSRTAAELAGTLARLTPTTEDKRQTREALFACWPSSATPARPDG